MTFVKRRIYEKSLAGVSLVAAISLAFAGLLLSPSHDIGSATCFTCAQFLTLTATLLGFDYKFSIHGSDTARDPK